MRFFLLICLSSLILSQPLSNVEKEVWSTVEAYSAASKKRDLEAYLEYWHPNFLGWHNGDDNPTNKIERKEALKWYFSNSKVLRSKLTLKSMIVNQNAAIVHIVIDDSLKWSSGKVSSGLSYWTDILIKENGKWYLISDHGGNVSKKDS